jgi:hypothetical protein
MAAKKKRKATARKISVGGSTIALSLALDLAAIITRQLVTQNITFRQIAEIGHTLGIKFEFETEPLPPKKLWSMPPVAYAAFAAAGGLF